MSHWEKIWEFNTARFSIVAEITDCDSSPEGQFSDARDVAAVRNGDVAWFDARVRVLYGADNIEIGSDYLGCCAYKEPLDLFRHHATMRARLRQLRGTMSHAGRRERKQLRKVIANNMQLKPPVNYGEYGPDMVRQAISAARQTVRTFAEMSLRTA
jgi:hypothetical protein